MTNKFYPIPFAKHYPVRVINGQIIRPTRLDVARDIVANELGLYSDNEIRQAKRIIIVENSK